jgi:hypothetical protein
MCAHILATKGKDISKRPRQKVRFVWGAGVDAELDQIAAKTLNAALTPQQQAAFRLGVRTQTVVAFVRAYSDIDVEIVESDKDQPDVHTVQMMPNSGEIFGQSLYDCGNVDPHQNSEIWVGTYRSEMVDSFNSGTVTSSGWGPMAKTDSWQVRMVDVGEALGRTSAHETGHSLGLVGSISGQPCDWMRGCDGGHNCDQVDFDYPLARRFNNGWFVMDPGGKTKNNARLAEPSPTGRAVIRTPATFNAFNRSYFSIVHPKP